MISPLTDIDAAYHEAGHATVALMHGWPLDKVTIVPSETTLGHVAMRSIPHTTTELRRMAAEIAWAGLFAQSLYRKTQIWDGDERARVVASFFVARHGAGSDLRDVLAVIAAHPEETEALTYGALRAVDDLLSNPEIWAAIGVLAEALISRGTLTQQEIEALVVGGSDDGNT